MGTEEMALSIVVGVALSCWMLCALVSLGWSMAQVAPEAGTPSNGRRAVIPRPLRHLTPPHGHLRPLSSDRI